MSKKNISLILFFSVGFLFSQTKKTLKVLFIGNSYTYVNNLPQLIKDVAKANGDSLLFDTNCPGGYSFFNHSVDATSISKMKAGIWNFVILQAQSQEPSFSPGQVNSQTLPFAIQLDSIVKFGNPCTPCVLYETWGRKYGDASNCAFYPPVCTYTGMQARLKQSYKQFADTTHGIMAPAGEAFKAAITVSPAIDLYMSDQSHPSIEGSYLAAAVFYETLFGKSVLSNTYNPGIGTATLTFLQQIAHSTVQDSLWTWNIGKNFPNAAFTFSPINQSSFQFNSKSPQMNNTWNFGDGTFSYLNNPTHTYTSSGNFTVTHICDNTCNKDTAYSKINALSFVSVTKVHLENNDLKIFPNPVKDCIYFDGKLMDNCNYKIYNLEGKIILLGTNEKIDVSKIGDGFYILELNQAKQIKYLKFYKLEH